MNLRTIFALALTAAVAAGVFFATSGYADGTESTLYACPMHPEITSHQAGSRCPKCHMYLRAVKTEGAASAPSKKKSATSKPSIHKEKTSSKPAAAAQTVAAGAPAKAGETAHEGAYFCPMHPEISSDQEGRCSICGMHLVLRDTYQPSEHGHDHATFVCPMHPDIVTDEAGRCPICGMDLVPKELGQKAQLPTRKIKYWVAPMDPKFIKDGPGKSPMGMDLVPVYEDESSGSVVKIDPVVVQNMGVRIARVRREPIFRHVRALGTVDIAENEVAVVNLRYSGWVEHLYVDETGAAVKRGSALAEVYSPELVAAQQEYLLALKSGSAGLARSAKMRLSFFGMSERDINKVAKREKALRTVTVRSPVSGFVLHKELVQGARVMAGKDLFRIGNLQKIWINAEVYENDAPWVLEGAPATMELSFEQGRVYSGKVSYVYPTLNRKTRTLRVRLEFDNPGLALKPGMFATVRIEARKKEGALSVPTEAVLHSGERELVFVALSLGRYQKREIVTGLVADRELTEVVEGLAEGERVVTSGQFLLDSESQLQEAVQKLLADRLHSSAPGAGAAQGEQSHEHAGESYWTCSMHPQVVQDAPGTCPICGMDLVEKSK